MKIKKTKLNTFTFLHKLCFIKFSLGSQADYTINLEYSKQLSAMRGTINQPDLNQ